MSSYASISPDKLARLIGSPKGPALIDVRAEEEFLADPRFVPGAARRDHAATADRAPAFAGRTAIVICQRGGRASEGVAAWLRRAGADRYDA